MSSFISCPGCGQLVLLGGTQADRSQTGLIACQNCQSQFDLGIMTPQIVSNVDDTTVDPSTKNMELELDVELEEPGKEVFSNAIQPSDHAGFLQAEPFEEGTNRSERDSHYISSSSEIEDDSELDWSVLGNTTPRPRKREASFFRKAIPPILGGLAAIPIAILILWHGFGQDIFNVGPNVARYIPWIVPREFAGTSTDYPRPPRMRSSRKGEPLESKNPLAPAFPTVQTKSENTTDIQRSEQPNSVEAKQVVSPEPVSPEPVLTKPDSPEPGISKLRSNERIDSNKTVHEDEIPKRSSAVDSVLESIATLQRLRDQLYESPKAAKMTLIVEYYHLVSKFSQQLAALSEKLDESTQQQVVKAGQELLKDTSTRILLQLGASGELEGVRAVQPDDYVAIVLDVDPRSSKHLTDRAKWSYLWRNGLQNVHVRLNPDSWIAVETFQFRSHTACLFLGKLEPGASAPDLEQVLQVHTVIPSE